MTASAPAGWGGTAFSTRHRRWPGCDILHTGGRPGAHSVGGVPIGVAIHIADYDPAWAARFEAEADRLHEALGDLALRIEHVGSTAVVHLAAKPVIDILVSVADLEPVDAYRLPLEAIGHTFTTMPFPYFHRPDTWPHTHHIHVRVAGSDDERRMLAFRDWLRSHPADRREYEVLKRSLARHADPSTPEGRYEYSKAKTEFILGILDRADRR